jgi:hypothetical protein
MWQRVLEEFFLPNSKKEYGKDSRLSKPQDKISIKFPDQVIPIPTERISNLFLVTYQSG